MNPLLRAARGGGGGTGSGGGGGGPPPTSAKHAYCLPKFDYYNGTYPFLDIVKTGGMYIGHDSATPGALNSDGWPIAMAPGNHARFKPVFAMPANGGYFPPGAYTVYSTSAATLHVNAGPGLSSISADAVGSVTFTASTLPGAWNTFVLAVDATNNTGSPIAVTDLKICLTSEKSLLDSGEIFKPQFLADHAGAAKLRFMDWLGVNAGSGYELRHYADMHDSLGRVGYGEGTYPTPMKVCAALCKKLNCAMHIATPPAMGRQRFKMDVATNRISTVYYWAINDTPPAVSPHELVEGERVMIDYYQALNSAVAPLARHTVYYAKNVTSTDFQLSLTAGGAAIDFTGTNNNPPGNDYAFIGSLDIDPIADMWTPMAQSAFAVWPQMNVEIEWANEAWGSHYPALGWCNGPGSYLATGGTGAAGAAYAYLSLKAWKAFEDVFPPAQIKRLFANQSVQPANVLSPAWEYVDPGIISAGQTLKAIMAASLSRSAYCIAPYSPWALNDGDDYSSAILFPTAYAANGNSEVIPDSYWANAFNRGIVGAEVGVSLSVSYARSKVPNIPITTYEWGPLYFDAAQASNVHGTAIGMSLRAYTNSAAFLPLFQDYYTRTITNFGVQHATHQLGAGGYVATNTNITLYTIKGSEDVVDPPRAAWFKTV